MTAAEQAWIDESLARLEELHEEREQAEAMGQMDRLAEIDEEIASLTEVLETVADASGPINVAANAPVAAAPVPSTPYGATAPHVPVGVPAPVGGYDQPPFGTAPQPVPAPNPGYYAPAMTAPAPAMAGPGMTAPQSPFAGPGATAPNPAVGGMPMGGGMPAPMQPQPMADYSDLGDDEYKSSKLPLVIGLVVLLVGGGVGAFFVFGGKSEPPPAPAQPAETKVITAAEVQEDNSDLDVAKGADVDRTPEREVKESADAGPAKRSGSSGNRKSGSSASSKKTKKGDERTLDLGKSRDPLSGV